ncbi:hypothetical protein BDA96_01G344000 [Sorghum bicolor]|uniref:Uncharacterized protein n=2 Tax=Sorghum bicolor TaxID=4558 RepID=A0A921S2L4_SORBI|nr:hypothetical protein BDA96_01G344000 [Sorghum bicolor]OQU92274.1 hypothetical protein SORBI_3001G320800 [Sorghum bicolor]
MPSTSLSLTHDPSLVPCVRPPASPLDADGYLSAIRPLRVGPGCCPRLAGGVARRALTAGAASTCCLAPSPPPAAAARACPEGADRRPPVHPAGCRDEQVSHGADRRRTQHQHVF